MQTYSKLSNHIAHLIFSRGHKKVVFANHTMSRHAQFYQIFNTQMSDELHFVSFILWYKGPLNDYIIK